MEPFHLPSQDGCILEFLLGEGSLFEYLDSLDYRETTCHFPAGDGVGKACRVVIDELFLDIVGEGGEVLDVGDDFGFDLLVDGQEGFLVGGGHAGERVGEMRVVLWYLGATTC